jgi:N-acetyl-anhydromuramyl-L-alanine amidase AmpD
MGVIKYTWKPAVGFTPGRAHPIECVLLHSTDGHDEGDEATLTGDHVSVHWYVEKDGTVNHFVQDSDTAWHAGVVDTWQHSNGATVGIEQEHIDGQEAWPDVQIQVCAQLVAALFQKHGISTVRSHAEVARPVGRKVDPEDYPWDEFHAYVNSAIKEPWTFEQIASEA